MTSQQQCNWPFVIMVAERFLWVSQAESQEMGTKSCRSKTSNLRSALSDFFLCLYFLSLPYFRSFYPSAAFFFPVPLWKPVFGIRRNTGEIKSVQLLRSFGGLQSDEQILPVGRRIELSLIQIDGWKPERSYCSALAGSLVFEATCWGYWGGGGGGGTFSSQKASAFSFSLFMLCF